MSHFFFRTLPLALTFLFSSNMSYAQDCKEQVLSTINISRGSELNQKPFKEEITLEIIHHGIQKSLSRCKSTNKTMVIPITEKVSGDYKVIECENNVLILYSKAFASSIISENLIGSVISPRLLDKNQTLYDLQGLGNPLSSLDVELLQRKQKTPIKTEFFNKNIYFKAEYTPSCEIKYFTSSGIKTLQSFPDRRDVDPDMLLILKTVEYYQVKPRPQAPKLF